MEQVVPHALQERWVAEAAKVYDLRVEGWQFLGHSDKCVFEVRDCGGGRWVLSVHSPREASPSWNSVVFYARESIASELELMDVLSKASSLGTAAPRRLRGGGYVAEVQGATGEALPMTMASFVKGAPMRLEDDDYTLRSWQAGVAAAHLHNAAIEPALLRKRPERRHAYVEEIMARIEEGRRLGIVSERQFDQLCHGTACIKQQMARLDDSGGRGLVHTDLRAANLIVQKDRVVPIDFSRAVDGYCLYDLGEMCAHMGGADIQMQVLRGYHAVRPLSQEDLRAVEGFFVLFILSVVSEFLFDRESEYVPRTLHALSEEHIPALLTDGFLPKAFYTDHG